jgi:signal transduction histidine kinase
MKPSANRASLALLLTVTAIAVPCAAWFIVGWREATQRAAELERAPSRLASETAARLAERLRDRLETLRENETKRPFYHYQNFYHDPRGAYEGVAVVPSPLTDGPMDPIIRTYFQLDVWGNFTLPQLNPQAPRELSAEEHAAEDAIRRQLELQAPTYVVAVQQQAQLQQRLEGEPPGEPSYQSSSRGSAGASPSKQQAQPQQRRVQQLDSQSWAQNVLSSEVYSKLRNPNQPQTQNKPTLEKLQATTKGNVEISTGQLQWHTIPINRVPSLVALRDVQTPYGRAVQGFLVSQTAVADLLKAAPFPARFLPEAGSGNLDAAVRLTGADWHVAVDARVDLAAAGAKARAIRDSFLRIFGWGVAAASIAGLCVVGLVWQTERLARQRSQFAASAAHELRTPLAGLRLYCDMLAEGLGDPSRAGDYARRVAEEAERLGRVVANVLGFTRLERGTLKVSLEPGDLAAAVRECVERQRAALEALGAKIEFDVAGTIPELRFDRDALAQILQNLLDNAEKHTRNAADRTIRVGLAASGNSIELSVSDRGPGIPRKVRRQLFRPFARGNHADAPAGLGLGLTLVRALVRAHGGEIRYADSNGGGARFVVTLPAEM